MALNHRYVPSIPTNQSKRWSNSIDENGNDRLKKGNPVLWKPLTLHPGTLLVVSRIIICWPCRYRCRKTISLHPGVIYQPAPYLAIKVINQFSWAAAHRRCQTAMFSMKWSKKATTLIISNNHSVGSNAAFYRNHYQGQGWTVETDRKLGADDAHSLVFKSRRNRVTIMILNDKNATRVVVNSVKNSIFWTNAKKNKYASVQQKLHLSNRPGHGWVRRCPGIWCDGVNHRPGGGM